MKNKIQVVLSFLLPQAKTVADGLHLLEATLGVNNNKEVDVRGDISFAEKIADEYQAATTVTSLAIAARDAADVKAITFITVTRELLKPTLGSRYAVAWNAVGFYNRTLKVPNRLDRRASLLGSIIGYLEAHPELAVAGTMTTEIGTALLKELTDGITAVNVAKSAQRQKKGERDGAAKTLHTRLQNVFHELKQFLPAKDPRWLEFGFNVPADLAAPGAPTVFSVVPGAAGCVFASWEMPAGATRIRLFQQVLGVDAEFVHVDTLVESSKYLAGLTPGAHVKFYVTAANAAGESLPSATVEVVVP